MAIRSFPELKFEEPVSDLGGAAILWIVLAVLGLPAVCLFSSGDMSAFKTPKFPGWPMHSGILHVLTIY